MKRWPLYGLLAALFVVRLDLWWWNDPTLVLGFPIGLLSQVVFCGLVVVVMALVVSQTWPHRLDAVESAIQGEGEQGS